VCVQCIVKRETVIGVCTVHKSESLICVCTVQSETDIVVCTVYSAE